MKKALLITLALVLVFGFAIGASAEERLSLSGQYRIRGFYTDNWNANSRNTNFDNDNKSNNNSYFDQRFRLGGSITPAEGISANFRFDFGEETWGNRQTVADIDIDTNATLSLSNSVPGVGRPTEDGEVQIDRLYLRLEREMFNFVGGKYNGVLGYTSAVDIQSNWLLARFKTPVVIDIGYIKIDEGTGTSDEEETAPPTTLNTEDDTAYVLQAAFNQENFGVGGFVGYRENKTQNLSASLLFTGGTFVGTIDTSVNENDLTVFGFYGNFNAGMFTLKGEVDIFSGENKTRGSTTKTDVKGQQVWLYGEVKLADNMKIPVNFLYAKGYADKTGETQAWQLAGAFSDFAPQSLANWAADYYIVPSTEIWDPAGTGGGVMGLMVGFDFMPMEAHNIYTQVGYVEPDKEVTSASTAGTASFEKQYWIQGAWVWNCLPSTELSAHVIYQTPKFKDSSVKDDSGWGLLTKLAVSF